MINGKRFCTINTDASLKGTAMGYAVWITVDIENWTHRITFTGDGEAIDSNHAEMQAVLAALQYMLAWDLEKYVDIIVVNSDSLNMKRHFEGSHSGNTKSKYDTVIYYYNIYKLLTKPIYFKHVRGHRKSTDSRQYVNNWADKAAKEARLKYEKLK